MQCLPTETLVNLCSNLDHQSLVNFSFTDKRNRDASKTFLFQHVRVNANDGVDLQAMCKRWMSFLGHVNSARHVRSLAILANLQPKNPPPRRGLGENPRRYVSLLRRSDGMLADKHCDPESRGVLATVEVQAIVDLITRLRGLRHLTWDCPWQPIPPPVLEVLVRMNCRLDLPSFRLHSLLRRSTQHVEIDGPDLQLATSPCLESVTLRYEDMEEAFQNYNYDALLDMVAGAAPNLRNVTLEYGGHFPAAHGHTSQTDPYFQSNTGPRKPWPSNLLSSQRSPALGALRSLDFRRLTSTNGLFVLSTKTDFSLLCSLQIRADVEQIVWLTDSLASLHTLDVEVIRDDATSEELQSVTMAFFNSLASLKCLTLRGIWTSSTLEVILERHGPTLLNLLCPANILPTCAVLVQQFCPVIEELSLPVQRTQGDAQEVSVYQILGQLPIRSLTLTLRQTDPIHTHEHFSETHQLWDPIKQLQSHFSDAELRDLLINCAVDEALVEAIFTLIASRKEILCLPRLESLNIQTENFSPLFTHRGYPRALLLPIAHLCGSWSCVRNPRDDCASTECSIKRGISPTSSALAGKKLEVGEDILGDFMEGKMKYLIEGQLPNPGLDRKVEECLRSVWPESGPWRDVCHSLRLACETI